MQIKKMLFIMKKGMQVTIGELIIKEFGLIDC
jgi:hypothetical protein